MGDSAQAGSRLRLRRAAWAGRRIMATVRAWQASAAIGEPVRRPSGAAALLVGLTVLLAAPGCTTVLLRAPAEEGTFHTARPYGVQGELLRVWGDRTAAADAEAIVASRIEALRRVNAEAIAAGDPIASDMLALSGGGPDGAFGAGLLAGWTARGDRPEFKVVSGVSTGAIIGLFAFLGPEHDATLRDIYTNFSTRDLLTPAILTGLLRGSAVADASGFRRLIAQYVDDAVVSQLAQAHAEGRLLLIGTTNLDATRPVIWNIGEIAASGHRDAKRLIQSVVEASAAIPGVFEPVLIPVETQGRVFDEMHVDGGATRQVLLYSPGLQPRLIDEALGVEIDRRLYVIMNNKLRRPHDPVRPRLLPIVSRAISSLIVSSGAGDVAQMSAQAASQDIPVGIVSVPASFDMEATEPFDRAYMRALYDVGYAMGREGAPWGSEAITPAP